MTLPELAIVVVIAALPAFRCSARSHGRCSKRPCVSSSKCAAKQKRELLIRRSKVRSRLGEPV